MLGNKRAPGLTSAPILPSASTLFGPRGACLIGRDGPLWVCDTGHHRLLGWRELPRSDQSPADFVIGQTDFSREGRNGKGEVGSATLNVPTGLCFTGKGLAVADAWNHRVLIWHELPTASNQPADVVLGQGDFTSNLSNRGNDTAGDNTLHWPYGISYDLTNDRLIVCDTGNRRALLWNSLPTRNGQKADCVLGQTDFLKRDENAGSAPSNMSMRWPHAAVFWNERLCVADAGNNRVLIWNQSPTASSAPADIILGQSDADSVDHNRALYWPRQNSLNMPYGVSATASWLLVADTANSRILGWRAEDLYNASDAHGLFGQPDFNEKGDNRWQFPVEDSLCWPYGVQAIDGLLTIADSGNNRVSIWELVT
jgi:hypothetical protein